MARFVWSLKNKGAYDLLMTWPSWLSLVAIYHLAFITIKYSKTTFNLSTLKTGHLIKPNGIGSLRLNGLCNEERTIIKILSNDRTWNNSWKQPKTN